MRCSDILPLPFSATLTEAIRFSIADGRPLTLPELVSTILRQPSYELQYRSISPHLPRAASTSLSSANQASHASNIDAATIRALLGAMAIASSHRSKCVRSSHVLIAAIPMPGVLVCPDSIRDEQVMMLTRDDRHGLWDSEVPATSWTPADLDRLAIESPLVREAVAEASKLSRAIESADQSGDFSRARELRDLKYQFVFSIAVHARARPDLKDNRS